MTKRIFFLREREKTIELHAEGEHCSVSAVSSPPLHLLPFTQREKEKKTQTNSVSLEEISLSFFFLLGDVSYYHINPGGRESRGFQLSRPLETDKCNYSPLFTD